jgi:hypothetical protein
MSPENGYFAGYPLEEEGAKRIASKENQQPHRSL